MSWGLKQRDLDAIYTAFSHDDSIDEVYIFGSRAKGNYREGSDIDLVIKGENFNADNINRLSFFLNEELSIPFYIDILYFNDLHDSD